MLYLVPKTSNARSNSFEQQADNQSHKINSFNKQFVSDYQPISSNLYSFYAHDGRYNLRCSMLLGLQDIVGSEFSLDSQQAHLIPIIVGDFPSIDAETVLEKSFGNEYIQGILTARFYLQILESLFYFAEDINASGLTLSFNDRNLDIIEIYRKFITSESPSDSERGNQTNVSIMVDPQNYNSLIDTIEIINQSFRQTLWRKQWGNPSIREYLKNHALTEF